MESYYTSYVKPRKTVCWSCKQPISSYTSDKCDYCNWLICNTCGSCSDKPTNCTYAQNGFNADGVHRNGTLYSPNGYDVNGYGRDGFNALGYDKLGYNKAGFKKDGTHKNGTKYSDDGFDRDGYSCNDVTSISGNCKIEVINLDKNETVEFIVDLSKNKWQQMLLGKCIGDTFEKFTPQTYRIIKIYPKK